MRLDNGKEISSAVGCKSSLSNDLAFLFFSLFKCVDQSVLYGWYFFAY